MKPPHESTIELSAEDIARGQREQQYAEYLRAFRDGSLSDERWRDLQADEDFAHWLLGVQ